MQKKHTITRDDMVGGTCNHILASSSAVQKKLMISSQIDVNGKIDSLYRVETPGRSHYFGGDLSLAIKAYNDI